MKTLAKLSFTGIATALLATAGAFANDTETRAVDNHHGSVIYLSRPAQKEATMAFGGHSTAASLTSQKVTRDGVHLRQVSTPHGTVSYFAPTE